MDVSSPRCLRRRLNECVNVSIGRLDELGELSLDLQPKLLRVLESRKIRRVGGSQSTHVDVRVIAATNRHLDEEVSAGRFREDLFYRLSVVRIFLPPLRERISDLPLLISHFLRTSNFNKGEKANLKVNQVSAIALKSLMAHRWSGNVRELLNVIERACTFAEMHILKQDDLPRNIQTQSDTHNVDHPLTATLRTTQNFSLNELKLMNGEQTLHRSHRPLHLSNTPYEEETLALHGGVKRTAIQDDELNRGQQEEDFESFKIAKERWISLFERDYILAALKRSNYNISHAAREAEIDRKYFRKLMQKYDIEIPERKKER